MSNYDYFIAFGPGLLIGLGVGLFAGILLGRRLMMHEVKMLWHKLAALEYSYGETVTYLARERGLLAQQVVTLKNRIWYLGRERTELLERCGETAE